MRSLRRANGPFNLRGTLRHGRDNGYWRQIPADTIWVNDSLCQYSFLFYISQAAFQRHWCSGRLFHNLHLALCLQKPVPATSGKLEYLFRSQQPSQAPRGISEFHSGVKHCVFFLCTGRKPVKTIWLALYPQMAQHKPKAWKLFWDKHSKAAASVCVCHFLVPACFSGTYLRERNGALLGLNFLPETHTRAIWAWWVHHHAPFL